MSRMLVGFHALALVFVAVAPLLRPGSESSTATADLPEFPSEIDGRALIQSSSSELEKPWLERFPGRIGRFTDGERLWILRQTAEPTLQLHSSARCLRAAGWDVEPARPMRDAQGRIWSTHVARLGERTAIVSERVVSLSTDSSWPDVDAWRWDAWLDRDPGPWCAYTSIEVGR